ncbi:MAG: energy transducer TonB [bacterium]
MRDYKAMYGVSLRVGIFSSIVIFVMLFTFVPYKAPQPYELKRDIATIIDIIDTEIIDREEPLPEERPRVAVPASSEVIDEAVETIVKTDFEEDPLRISPVGPEIEVVPYYRLEIKPRPVFSAKPAYPEICRQAGIEGTTVVKMLIDIDGSVIDVKILKSSGNQLLDQSAIAAARKSTFTPAKQRDKLVRVWVSRSVRFQLK